MAGSRADSGAPSRDPRAGRSPRHPAGVRPLIGPTGLVAVDGRAICEACGREVEPIGDADWRHTAADRPVKTRPPWLEPVAMDDLEAIQTYQAFARRKPWAVRRDLNIGGVTSEADWQVAWDRLRCYRAALDDGGRAQAVAPGLNPYLELARLLDGDGSGHGGDAVAWTSPIGILRALSLGERRRELVDLFAWAIPNEPALDAIVRRGPIVEVGAGTGYWAALLRARSADVVAFDQAPPGSGPMNVFHTRRATPWTPVASGLSAAVVRPYADRTLFLCWPPNEGEDGSYDAIRAYRGDVIAYIGEGPDGGGGSLRFHRELGRNWTAVETVELPRWPRIQDRLVIYERNAFRRPLVERDRCPECGRYRNTGSIGRCDRCFASRPPALALRMAGHRIEYPVEALDQMPAGLRQALERSPNRIC